MEAGAATNAIHQGQRCHTLGKVITSGRATDGMRLRCTSVQRGAGEALVWQYHGPTKGTARKSCVILDNDFDIDDLMAIPVVLGSKHVAAIVQSEGYTTPAHAAPAVDRLVNHIPDRPRGRQVPIIVGGAQATSPDLTPWPWLPFFRSMMNRSNGLLKSVPAPWPTSGHYKHQVARSVAHCESVSILIIGTYTSFNNYLPLIKQKVDRVVVMGQAIGDHSRTQGRESFNCRYDLDACRSAMPMLARLKTYFVEIPRFDDCHDKVQPPTHCYTPNEAMVTGRRAATGSRVGGLRRHGLPGHLRSALVNKIACSAFYTTPATKGRPCSSRSTWEPGAVAKGPGGEMLLWDQTAAMFLVQPQAFSLYYPPGHPELGGKHYEPTLVNGSDAQTVQKLRRMWTRFSNWSARIR